MTMETSDENDTGRRVTIAVFKGPGGLKSWLKRVARKDHMPVSVVIDVALKEYAERRGHEPMPSRQAIQE